MSPFQEYEASKVPGREGCRSRIPRLVLRPCGSVCKRGPSSDCPLLVEESRRCGRSPRTRSHNSFCSDDTGCPSSHLASPSGTDTTPLGSPLLGERKASRKRACVASGRDPQQRRGGEQRSTARSRGGHQEFGSSGRAGSGTTWQRPSGAPPSYHPRRTGVSAWDVEPHTPERTPSSPGLTSTPRRSYHSCWDNHGIRPPNPEQYLTPLQQKEVVIRHLRSKLKESESRVLDREAQVKQLKVQLGRMRDDWIEEECHRVEAQLALKEARREIKQLRHVVETMRSSLIEKDKGIQKYFIDINIQNRKLEALLRSMEAAQSGAAQGDCVTGVFGLEVAEETVDSGVPVSGETVDWVDAAERELGSDLDSVQLEMTTMTTVAEVNPAPAVEEKAVQTDVALNPPELQSLLLHLLKLRDAGVLSEVPGSHSTETAVAPAQTPLTPVTPDPLSPGAETLVAKRYWSSSFLVDLVAVAAPALPTLAWLYCTHRAGTEPVYNIASLIRGCCAVGLRSLRRVPLTSGV
ncbi:syntabulin-like isoform X4 [Arapaima gigas]